MNQPYSMCPVLGPLCAEFDSPRCGGFIGWHPSAVRYVRRSA